MTMSASVMYVSIIIQISNGSGGSLNKSPGCRTRNESVSAQAKLGFCDSRNRDGWGQRWQTLGGFGNHLRRSEGRLS